MAFTKQIITSSGYTAGYWQLSEWTFNKLRAELRATFRVYRDAEAASAGMSPASEQVAKLRLSGEEYQAVFGPDRDFSKSDQQLIYETAKVAGVTSDFQDQDDPRKLFKRAERA